MTKKDYALIAEAVRETVHWIKDRNGDPPAERETLAFLVGFLETSLSRKNGRFDAGKFRAACGLDLFTAPAPEDPEPEPANTEYEPPNEPEEGDYTTSDYRQFFQYEKLAVTVPEGGEWQKSVRRHMDREQFWPNVWFISDHGNPHLLTLED
jgi:hypothetical protein